MHWYNWEWNEGGDEPAHPFDVLNFQPEVDAKEMNFKEAVGDALRLLQAQGLPLVILYSGGLDSEIILQEAIELGIPITPIAIRFAGGLNDHDMEWVRRFPAETYYIDVDFEQWVKEEYPRYVEEFNFVHYAAPLNFWARKEVERIFGDVTCITGTGDLPLARIPSKTKVDELEWFYCFSFDSQWKRLKWYRENYPQDAGLFFAHTATLVKAFLNEKEIVEGLQSPLKLSISSSKKALYHRHWPTLQKRPKFTGFEMINIDVGKILDRSNQISTYMTIPYADFERHFRD